MLFNATVWTFLLLYVWKHLRRAVRRRHRRARLYARAGMPLYA
jgi:hypothetical protein